ncbi:alpha/beta hydrolase [Lewinella sp. W8]|uniref:alpha/beta hydrolase n=1 Tax=Lewinella sp. W8 TaxID=2528208 RepID=UPI0010676CDC|nr:alpha/beta fold hydrolase [Lewinella sp. W8]MTB50495.1 prolyl oligopeptidase family serine peptidase [Lewinella sp. W8]
MRKLILFLATMVVLYLGVTYFFSGLILHTPDRDLATVYQMNQERWSLNLDSLLRTLPGQESVEFVSGYDDIKLKGWLFLPDTVTCGVVMAHGYSVNRANMLKYAPIFADCNCALMLYDHRGHGESDEAYGSGGYHEASDLITATEILREKTDLTMDKIGWFGESWGGATVLLAAARQEAPKPAWVVAESPFADWESAVMERGVKDYGPALYALTPGAFTWTGFRAGVSFDEVSPVLAAKDIDVPVLLLHSRADTLTAPEQSDRIAKNIRPELLTYHALDWGAWHAHNIIWRRDEYTRIVRDFVGDFCN